MLKLALLCLVAATIAAILDFNGVSDVAAPAAVLFFVAFAAFFVFALFGGPLARVTGAMLGTLTGLLLFGSVALVAVWLSDRYSLETAGHSLDRTLADARERLVAAADDLPDAARGARDSVSRALDEAGEAVEGLDDGDSSEAEDEPPARMRLELQPQG